MNLIFLDVDGVLNCQVYYEKVPIENRPPYPLSEFCPERISWLNQLCEEVNAKVVLSASRRTNGIEENRAVFKQVGATFEIIDVTPNLRSKDCLRGNEIYTWIKENIEKLTGIPYYDYNNYVIIDDDSDMLLWQKEHFFQTDTYSGLTPNTCYKIKRFFDKQNKEF
jgi:hypothetical protein